MLGEVIPSLRGITFDYNDDLTEITIFSYYDSEITEEIEEINKDFEAEIIANFSENRNIHIVC